MITEKDFENLLAKTESSILDFKAQLYDFKNEKNFVATSKFVKDIISFTNTIRTETSYIIFGIEENENGILSLIGIDESIDDAILQDKIKDKVFPRPIFSYYNIFYKNKNFGVLEFPISRYEIPITPSVNSLKGLETGKVYYRNGTSNTEATGIDVIRINDWLKTLPNINNDVSVNDKISELLSKLADKDIKLSVILPELLGFAKQNKLADLIDFCIVQIQGIIDNTDNDINIHQYRAQKVFVSYNKVEINPYSFIKVTTEILKKEFENNDDFFDLRMIFHQPILEIEQHLDRIGENVTSSIVTMETSSKNIIKTEKEITIYIYFFPDNFINLYRNIRQKAIDLLMII